MLLCKTVDCQDSYHCEAFRYAAPGFQSNRHLFPPDKHDPRVWDGMRKVAFQKSDCSWLAANFKDTGSQFVAILFAGFTQHKVYMIVPARFWKPMADRHQVLALRRKIGLSLS